MNLYPDFLIPQGVKYNYFQNLVRLTLGDPIEALNAQKKQKVRVQYWQNYQDNGNKKARKRYLRKC